MDCDALAPLGNVLGGEGGAWLRLGFRRNAAIWSISFLSLVLPFAKDEPCPFRPSHLMLETPPLFHLPPVHSLDALAPDSDLSVQVCPAEEAVVIH